MSDIAAACHGRSRSNFFILSFFFLTGLTGLVYELVWIRLLILAFGSTQFAVTTVLVAFMSGLALGSLLHEGCLGGLDKDRFSEGGYPVLWRAASAYLVEWNGVAPEVETCGEEYHGEKKKTGQSIFHATPPFILNMTYSAALSSQWGRRIETWALRRLDAWS